MASLVLASEIGLLDVCKASTAVDCLNLTRRTTLAAGSYHSVRPTVGVYDFFKTMMSCCFICTCRLLRSTVKHIAGLQTSCSGAWRPNLFQVVPCIYSLGKSHVYLYVRFFAVWGNHDLI